MIKLENIYKYYYSTSNVTCALRKINLEFKLGEFIAITGESGSGKSSLLNVISGFEPFEDGEIYFNGKELSYFDDKDWEKYRKDEIAFIFQNYNLVESYTVLENVMIIYIMEGYTYEEAKSKSLEKLKEVGLDSDVNKKTSKLSGGQKQRLAIARALAKETNVIIADEPTGNLDEENGKAILKILKRLSLNKLVIVVSHNIAQIEPFITRKIRLHDGELVSDEIIQDTANNIVNKEIKEEKNDFRKIINFSFFNLKAQKYRTLFVFLIVLITVLSSYVFFINFKANLNDYKTKLLESDIFYNFDETRMLVRTFNQDVITEELMEEANVNKVTSIEKYDYVTDVNYFRPSDYKYVHKNGYTDPKDPVIIDMSYYRLQDFSHFMRSASSLSSDMLAYGRLPENPFEMVVYSNDTSLLDTTEIVMFNNQRLWSEGKMYKYEFKIVGILKEVSDQAYFSDKFCQMIDFMQYDFRVKINFVRTSYGREIHDSLYMYEIVIDPNIGNCDISFSKELLTDAKSYRMKQNSTVYVEDTFINTKFIYNQETGHDICSSAIGVSENVFDAIYNLVKSKTQFAIFIEDYAFVDEVTDDLIDKGFDSLSCFEASTSGYDITKVISRYINLSISIVALVLINVVAIVLIYTILKFKKNDYLIMKMNGMSNKLCRKINLSEMLFYGIVAYIIGTIIVLLVANTSKNLLIIDVFKYVKVYDYLIILFIILITMIYIVKLYDKYLKARTKISSLKED